MAGWFDWMPFVGDDEEEDDIESQAIQYYRDNKGKSLMMNSEGNGWALDYIPSSLSRADQQQWMMLSDGKLGIRR
jgi:hypothetical protein